MVTLLKWSLITGGKPTCKQSVTEQFLKVGSGFLIMLSCSWEGERISKSVSNTDCESGAALTKGLSPVVQKYEELIQC